MQTQNLMFSDDAFSIPNHSHFMIMVSCMFDPVVYLTDDKYFEIHGKHVNVQSIIEKYYLYILAWWHSGEGQLFYSWERLEDLLNLSENVEYRILREHLKAPTLHANLKPVIKKWRLLAVAFKC